MENARVNNWCLALLTHEQADHQDKNQRPTITMLGGISDESSDQIDDAIKELYFYTSGEDLYYSFQRNLEEFLESIHVFANGYQLQGVMTADLMKDSSLNFSRLMLNLLGMFRSFLDHGQATIIRRFGDKSPEHLAWLSAQSAEYDSSSAYRICHNLRNYAQHVGMPPIRFSLAHSLDDGKVAVTLEFVAAELLENYSKWSADAKKDLLSGPEKIDILHLLEEWALSFSKLVVWIQTLRRAAILKSAELLAGLRKSVGVGKAGQLLKMVEPILANETQGLKMTYRNLPEDTARRVINNELVALIEPGWEGEILR
ncbi:MAG TPA: hypothetical protein VF682_13160 [Pseudomonas sp.]